MIIWERDVAMLEPPLEVPSTTACRAKRTEAEGVVVDMDALDLIPASGRLGAGVEPDEGEENIQQRGVNWDKAVNMYEGKKFHKVERARAFMKKAKRGLASRWVRRRVMA